MTKELSLKTVTDLQMNFKQVANDHLQLRFSDNPEFQKNFIKTFSDMVFSMDEEKLEELTKMRRNSLLNAVFKATEAGASFAKKEVSLLPFQIIKKTTENGVEKKKATGELDATVILDINFQKQQILKLQNCKRFFTAEVHEGVKIIEDLETGNIAFSGENDVTKPTIGYYAVFITTEGEKYDLFMSNALIIERASVNPHYRSKLYENTRSNIHYEKIVIRNLIKDIPRVSEELKSILAYDDTGGFTSYIEVVDEDTGEITNKLEEAKKELATGKDVKEEKAEPVKEEKPTAKAEKPKAKEEPKKSSETAADFF